MSGNNESGSTKAKPAASSAAPVFKKNKRDKRKAKANAKSEAAQSKKKLKWRREREAKLMAKKVAAQAAKLEDEKDGDEDEDDDVEGDDNNEMVTSTLNNKKARTVYQIPREIDVLTGAKDNAETKSDAASAPPTETSTSASTTKADTTTEATSTSESTESKDATPISLPHLATTIATLSTLSAHPQMFEDPALRALRTAIHPFLTHHQRRGKKRKNDDVVQHDTRDMDVDIHAKRMKQMELLMSMDQEEENHTHIMTQVQTDPIPTRTSCYICHSTYHTGGELCPSCTTTRDTKHKLISSLQLTNRIAFITGGRIGLGYTLTLHLLRAGCEVIITTRYPRDATERLGREHDFDTWRNRIHVMGCDFRSPSAMTSLCQHIHTRFTHLDIIISCASASVLDVPVGMADWVKKEAKTYDDLDPRLRPLLVEHAKHTHRPFPELITLPTTTIPTTTTTPSEVPHKKRSRRAALKSTSTSTPQPSIHTLPTHHTWNATLDTLTIDAVTDVMNINVMTPMEMLTRLKSMMRGKKEKWVMMVSTKEGKFSSYKSGHHPHTNMSRAAQHMLIRTIAPEWYRDGIYINVVDVSGCVDGDEYSPLTLEDGVDRILDVIAAPLAVSAEPPHGMYLRHYMRAEW